jgi:hypothetical protein
MEQKSAEEIEGDIEEKKVRTKQFNKFFSDYFSWVVAGVVVVVFVFGFFILLLPKYEQTVNYINAVDQQQILDVSAKQNELDKIKKLVAAYNSIDKRYIDKVNGIAPTIQNKEELFSELNYFISVNQLFLQSISLSESDGYQDQGLVETTPAQAAISNSLETVRVTISVRGINYESFKNLLSALENNLRLMDVLSVGFNPGDQNTVLTINTYYSKK